MVDFVAEAAVAVDIEAAVAVDTEAAVDFDIEPAVADTGHLPDSVHFLVVVHYFAGAGDKPHLYSVPAVVLAC